MNSIGKAQFLILVFTLGFNLTSFSSNSSCNAPTGVVFAMQATCTDDVPNDNAYLQLSEVNNGDKVNWVEGSTYADGETNYSDGTSIGSLPFKFALDLANPSGAQDYTIRIFNGSSTCYTDIVITLKEQDCLVECDCKEHLYLNDTGFGEVHKFSINPNDGTIAEVGSPWMSGLTNPHGLGSDLNGNLYIGDHNIGPIYKINSQGGTVANDATLWFTNVENGLTNIGSIDNYIFMNGHPNGGDGKKIYVLDACSGEILGTICLNNAGSGSWSSDWGLQVFQDGTILITDGQGWGPDSDYAIWHFKFDPAMINNPSTCIDALVVNNYLSSFYDVVGITGDETYLYVLGRDASANSTLMKIDANTGALVQSVSEGGWNGSGYNGALGIVHAPSSGYLYVSGYEDCIAIVDPSDLSYVGPGNGTIPTGGAPKAISILSECCPKNNNIVVDTILCGSESESVTIYLQELINCQGTICEGTWIEGPQNIGLNYDNCNNTVEIVDANGCGTFTLESDGLGNTNNCGAFKFTINICLEECPNSAVGNRVWLDENANGIQDAGESGIPDVMVELSEINGSSLDTVITDALGGYIFQNVKQGQYSISVLSNVPVGLVPIYDEDDGTTNPDMSIAVSLNANEYMTANFGYNYASKNHTDNPTTFNEPGAIGDRIWHDDNANGLQDPGEAGIPNITVELWTDINLDGYYTSLYNLSLIHI